MGHLHLPVNIPLLSLFFEVSNQGVFNHTFKMVIGWKEMTPRNENEVGVSSVGQTILVDERLGITNQNSKEIQVVTTTGESKDPLANEKRTGDKLHVEVVRAELRARYL